MKRHGWIAAAALAAFASAAPAHANPSHCNLGRIVFTRFGDDGIPTIYSADPCSGRVAPLVIGHHATLSPDGRVLAYDSIPDGETTTDVFIANPDGSAPRNVTNSPATNDIQPAFAPDGRTIAFSTGTDGVRDARIATRDLASGRTRTITPVLPEGEAFNPSWSPSGRRIVFDTLPTAGPSYVWMVRADGSRLHKVTSDADDACEPDWGPQGLIAYMGGCDQLQSHLFLRDPRGQSVRQLTADADGGSSQKPAFSPDGSMLTFSKFPADGSDSDVWRLDLRTGREIPVVTGPTYDEWSNWGPAR